MRKEQGFTLIELLIVVAIIAIIAAIAVPNLMTARMAANEASAISALRSIGSAQSNYAANNNQFYAPYATLITEGYLDSRFNLTAGTINGYKFRLAAAGDISDAKVGSTVGVFFSDTAGTGDLGYVTEPVRNNSTGRQTYILAPDFVIRYLDFHGIKPKCGGSECAKGDPVGGSTTAAGT